MSAATDSIVVDRRNLQQRRIVWAFWFALIWLAFFAWVTVWGEYSPMIYLLGGLLAFYFMPTIIALSRGHHHGAAILMLNLLLGWTFLGWVVALVWSYTAVRS